jgi:hypothetical protein
MSDTDSDRGDSSRHKLASTVAGILCFGAGVALFVAVIVLFGQCQEGTAESCPDSDPNFELVLQVVLAAICFAATILMCVFVNRRSYGPAGALLAVSVLVFAAWALFLDAAQNGWDDLTLL